ncbi:gp14 neck protein [Delftia phage PhiW-14]|uniref:Gp14 neck protein n=1 Tax=Delftia phage PhiW-14 TaxID=665032 RepID=C9DG21_BPW14|nr:head closure Hc2 [Delftia phage PhiW-14]ACV50072.1 gp14 neck protein [Delftia phage PhiW-14]
MAVNAYLNSPSAGQVQGQDLLESLIIESIQASGQDVLFMRKEQLALDPLYRESVSNQYQKGWEIEMYQYDVVNFNGDGDLFSKFGLISTDQCTLQVAKTRFEVEARANNDPNPAPLEDDVIYMPMSKTLWRIRKVKEDPKYYRHGKNYVWRLECVTYDPSNEDFVGDELGREDFGEMLSDKAVDGMSKALGLKPSDQQNQGSDLEDAGHDAIAPKFDQNNPFEGC